MGNSALRQAPNIIRSLEKHSFKHSAVPAKIIRPFLSSQTASTQKGYGRQAEHFVCTLVNIRWYNPTQHCAVNHKQILIEE